MIVPAQSKTTAFSCMASLPGRNVKQILPDLPAVPRMGQPDLDTMLAAIAA